MAQRTIITLFDDLDGTAAEGGVTVSTVPFALDGKSYEIDLTAANEDKLRELLAPYIRAGRRLAPATFSSHAAGPKKKVSSVPDGLRDWAKANGVEINGRGRIAKEIGDAFRAYQNGDRSLLERLLEKQHGHMPGDGQTEIALPGQRSEDPAATEEKSYGEMFEVADSHRAGVLDEWRQPAKGGVERLRLAYNSADGVYRPKNGSLDTRSADALVEKKLFEKVDGGYRITGYGVAWVRAQDQKAAAGV